MEVLSKYGPRNIAVRFMSHYAICALVSAFKLCPFPADESECESLCILDSSPTVSHADFAPIPATEHCGFRNGWDRAHLNFIIFANRGARIVKTKILLKKKSMKT